ncbi:hypothetical protein QWY85_08660 [Neolewinella lacunae]|uniref:Uncharacterized protein n=1 Tax=Neolewinella lacunae TaxID=1517758 RepID=A0A923PL26_9BACT|nr:hypothetical protein [Neolewinella lacunae]MBC6993646.1 hypothetical protein [Neolewinella lacunae]MDN3634726.1 hypothetical protein [Neolewinella lacunae]
MLTPRAFRFWYGFVLFWALPQVQGWGQELRTNAAGEKIIVYADGTARYFNDLTLIDAMQKDSARNIYPVVKATIEPLADGVDPTEADLKHIAERKLQLAREAEALARTRASAAVSNRLQLERDLESARSGGRLEAANALQRRLQLARQVETNALADRTAAETRAAAAAIIVQEGRYVDAYNAARRSERRGPTIDKPATRTERSLEKLLPAEPVFSGFGPAAGRLPLYEAPPCGNPVGLPSVNNAQAVTFPRLLFTHTDENLRPFLDGKEYLRCTAYLTRDDRGERYLHLTLTFANANAMTSYGFLPENSSLSLHLLNGRHISLQAAREVVGIIDHGRRELNYNVDYRLPRGAAQELGGQALDYVRIFWSGGYEEYQIYQVDALRQLVTCY